MAKKNKPLPGNHVIQELPAPYGGEILFYQTPDGSVKLDVRLEKETIWLNLNQMASLFQRDKSVISRHLRNVFREGELDRASTVAFFATVQDEGGRQVTRKVEYYNNLDAVISVGYRVNSKRGTQFRICGAQQPALTGIEHAGEQQSRKQQWIYSRVRRCINES